MRILDQLQKAMSEKVKNGKANGETNGNGMIKHADPSPSPEAEPEAEPESPELDAMLATSAITDEEIQAMPASVQETMKKARDAARAIKSEKPS